MNIKVLAVFLALVLNVSLAWAGEGVKDFNNFKKIPILDSGRVKPLDTYARSLLTQFSGKDHYEKKSASQWLADLLFAPERVNNDKVFLINNPDIAVALGLPADPHRRYTPQQLKSVYRKIGDLQAQARNIPEKDRSLVENEILRVFDNINLYADLSRSFLFAFPQPDFTITSAQTKTALELPQTQQQFSFLDIALKASTLADLTKGLEQKIPAEYTKDDSEIRQVAAYLMNWSLTYKDFPFTVIPLGHDQQWLSAWDAIRVHFTDESTHQLIVLWNNMAVSYAQGNDVEFNVATHAYLGAVEPLLSKDERNNFSKFALELFYHASSPFTLSIMFYILAFHFFVVSFASPKKIWYTLGLSAVIAGFIPHTLGLVARIIIMSRPPVSNLYETFIFVAFIAVLLGILIEYYNKQWLGIVTAAISGTALLFIANKYSAEGDTLKMLIAVLNSNFWLATHVTTITIGYAATCVAGILGHVWLIQAAAGKDQQTLDSTYKTTLGILGLSLTLTFLGTNLGGIWADQSWGRFWGWDPKENGALMIVLWVAMLLHARVAKMIDALGLAVGAVLGTLVVMWAWFGVNLLSVGLHSYGFTSGVATNLIIYAVSEIVFIAVTMGLIINKKH